METTPQSLAERQLSDAIADITNELLSPGSANTIMSEQQFVTMFLPMFAGEQNPNPMYQNVTPYMWLNAARGPFNEVTVVDDSGVKLFDVPTVFSQEAIQPLDGTGKAANLQTVSDMVNTARLYANRGAGVVDQYIINEMGKRSFMFNKDVDSTDSVNRWNAIFTRYGKKPIPLDTAHVTVSTNADNIARDSSEFDPL